MVSSAAVEVGPLRTNSESQRQRTVDELVATAGGDDFAGTLAALGVRQVVVAKNADPGEDYAWVGRQPGLEPLSSDDTMDSFRVLTPTPGQSRLVPVDETTYEITAGAAGPVVLPEECSEGWQIDGEPGTCTDVGTVVFDVGPGPNRVDYAPWNLIRTGVVVSLAMLLLLIIIGLAEHARDIRGRSR
jgi:hypothetical protein